MGTFFFGRNDVGVLLTFSGQGQRPDIKGFSPVYNDLSLDPDSTLYISTKYLCTVLTSTKNEAWGKIVDSFL